MFFYVNHFSFNWHFYTNSSFYTNSFFLMGYVPLLYWDTKKESPCFRWHFQMHPLMLVRELSFHSKLQFHQSVSNWQNCLTHWGRVTHICVGKLSIIGSDNGLSPGRRQAIIWTNAGMLLIGPLGTNFSEILIEILTFSFKKMRLKVSPAKWRPFCLGLNVLRYWLAPICC